MSEFNPTHNQQPIDPERAVTATEVLEASQDFRNYFGIEADPVQESARFIKALNQVNPRFTGARELVRNELEQDHTKWAPEAVEAIMKISETLGNLDYETPLEGEYPLVITLGAARKAPVDRVMYAADSVRQGKIKQLTMVGSARRLPPAEQEATADYAPGAVEEFDLCIAAAAQFAKKNPGNQVGLVYVADEKANTGAVVTAVLEDIRSRGLPMPSRLGAITTQIYQKFTALDVSRVAEQFGIHDVHVAGNPSDPAIVANRTPSTYLTEVLRTLEAASRSVVASQEYEASYIAHYHPDFRRVASQAHLYTNATDNRMYYFRNGKVEEIDTNF